MSSDFQRFRQLTNGEFDIHLGVARALRDVLERGQTYTFTYEGSVDGRPMSRDVRIHNAAEDAAFFKEAVTSHGHYNDMFGWKDLSVTANGIKYPIFFDTVTDLAVGAFGDADVAMPECYTLGKVSFTVSDAETSYDTCRSFANFVLIDGVLHGPLIVDYSKRVSFKSNVTGQMNGRLGFVKVGGPLGATARVVAASVAAIFPDSNTGTQHVFDGVLVQGARDADDAALTPATLGALVVLDAMVNSGVDKPCSLAPDTVAELMVIWPHEVAALEVVDGTTNVVVREGSYVNVTRYGRTLRSCPALEEFFTRVQRMDSDDPVMLILQTLHADEQLSFVLNSEAPLYEPRGEGVSCWAHSLAYVFMVNLFGDARYSLFHHVIGFFLLLASKFLKTRRTAHGSGHRVSVYKSEDGIFRAVVGNKSGKGENAFDNTEIQGPANGDDSIWASMTGDSGQSGPFHLIAKGCTVFTKALGFGDDFVINVLYEEPISVLGDKLFVTARPKSAGGVSLGELNHAVVCGMDGEGVFNVVYDPLRKLEGKTFTKADRPGKVLAPSAYEGALVAAPVRVNYNGSIVVMNGGDALTRDNFEVFGG